MNDIESMIDKEEKRLDNSTSPNDKLNIMYNLIVLKNASGNTKDNYLSIKKLIDYYIELIKISDYG